MSDRDATSRARLPDGSARAVSLLAKARLLDAPWQPRVVAELNDYQFKVARLEGDFVWHDHPDTDEAFLVLEGRLRIDLPDDDAVHLEAGDLFVVPAGLRHKPFAEEPTLVLLVEPRGVRNTGSTGGARTAADDVWI